MPSLSDINKTKTWDSNTENDENYFQKKFYDPKEFDDIQENGDSTFKMDDEPKKCLSYLQSSLLATVLEDTITEMRILAECNNELRAQLTKSDMVLLLAQKFNVKQPEVTDELDGIDTQNLENDNYKLHKLANDRTFFVNSIIETYKHLIENKNYNALKDRVNGIVNLDKYRVDLADDEAKNRVLRRELNKQLRQQRNHIKTIIYDTDVVIENLNVKVEDASLHAEICCRYVDRWQVARTEQHLQTIREKESPPSSIIEYYKNRADTEQRVHAEVELLFSISINETLEKVEEWMTKYDKDMEGIDLKIQLKKNEYQDTLDRRIDLGETIEKHDALMQEWIHFKEEREKLRAYREKMTKSAIMVQAWWRGLLVRLQLGPFKVTKKKPGQKKK